MRDHLAGLDATHVSYSEMNTLATCEEKWYQNYVLRKEGEPSLAMKFGTVMHALTEDWWSAVGDLTVDDFDVFQCALDAGVELPNEGKHSYEDAEWLMQRYSETYAQRRAWDRPHWHRPDWFTPETSLSADVIVPGVGPITVRGTMDDYLVDPDGRNVLVERKTMADWRRLDLVDVTPQETIYTWLARANDIPVDYVLFDAIKTYRWKRDVHPAQDSFQAVEVFRDQDQIEGGLDWMRSILERRAHLYYQADYVGRNPIKNISDRCTYCAYQDSCWESLSFPDRTSFVLDEEDA